MKPDGSERAEYGKGLIFALADDLTKEQHPVLYVDEQKMDMQIQIEGEKLTKVPVVSADSVIYSGKSSVAGNDGIVEHNSGYYLCNPESLFRKLQKSNGSKVWDSVNETFGLFNHKRYSKIYFNEKQERIFI